MKATTENYCGTATGGCDNALLAIFDSDEFWAFKVGPVRCPDCGEVNMPCNECFGTSIEDEFGCSNCPWKNARVTDAMTDEEFNNAGGNALPAMPIDTPYAR